MAGSNHATNWKPTGVPGISDTAWFRLNQTYTVRFAQNQSINSALITDGVAQFAADRSIFSDAPLLQLSGQLRTAGSNLWIGDDGDLSTFQDYMHVSVAGATTA